MFRQSSRGRSTVIELVFVSLSVVRAYAFRMFDGSEIEVLAAGLSRLDPCLAADADVIAVVRTIEKVRTCLDAAEGRMLLELDARGTTDAQFGFRTAAWLARDAHLSRATASRRLRAARTLACDLPETEEALRTGGLSFDQACVMAGAVNPRILDEFRELEPELIAMAKRWTFDRWKRHVQAVAALLDQDGAYDPNEDIDNNRLVLAPGPDGTRLSGHLVGDTALTVEQSIQQVTDELYRQYAKDHQETNGAVAIPSQRTLRALAVAEICRRAMGATASRTHAEASLVITTDRPDDVYDLDGMRRTGTSALLCDMSVFTLLVNSLGVPLDMGREIRTANREQRRALARRDGGCIFPGCGERPHRCDAHHVAHWWRDLGTTDVRHMVFLCRHHHGVIHRRGWSISLGDDGWAWITTPGGSKLWCQRHGVTRAGPAPPLAA